MDIISLYLPSCEAKHNKKEKKKVHIDYLQS